MSLIVLPILLFISSQQQIDNLLRKGTIEFVLPVADGSFVEDLQLFPRFAAKYKKFTYSFHSGDEKAQIDSFRSLHTSIDKQYSKQLYYFVITVDAKCSYNLYMQVLDILEQTKYNYEYRKNVLYARRLSEETSSKIIKYLEVSYSNSFNELREKYFLLSTSQQSAIVFIGIVWLLLLVLTVKRNRNILSAS